MNQHAFMTDDEREETVIERRERERTENGKVDNDEPIPLLPNITKDARKTIVSLQVWKSDPPGDGYKGNVPPHADVETIAKLYGNGIYEFHGVTQDSKVLRRVQGVKIAWQPPEKGENPANVPVMAPSTSADKLLDWQATQHAKDSERVESFARMSVESSHATAKQHIDTLAQTLRASQERDRDFFAGMMANQQNFFAAMFQQATLAHTQAMERSREDFRQSIQVMQISHERAQQAQDPSLLLSLFERGLALGSGGDGESEEAPWGEVIKSGVGAIKDMTELAKIKAGLGTTPAKTLPPATLPNRKTPNTPETPKKKPPIDKEELAEVLRLKKILEQKGMDFATMVRQASSHFIGGNDVDQSAPANSDPSGIEGDSEGPGPDAGEADVD
jgi:hypothetical protein